MSVTNPNGANLSKVCINCLQPKGISCFELRSDTGKYRCSCKDCENDRKSGWYEKNKATMKIRFLKKKYGLSREKYEALLVSQNHLCAICLKEETSIDGRTKKKKSLSIDHCHRTGSIRGILCWRCNAMIGYSGDNIEVLRNAIRYLESCEK